MTAVAINSIRCSAQCPLGSGKRSTNCQVRRAVGAAEPTSGVAASGWLRSVDCCERMTVQEATGHCLTRGPGSATLPETDIESSKFRHAYSTATLCQRELAPPTLPGHLYHRSGGQWVTAGWKSTRSPSSGRTCRRTARNWLTEPRPSPRASFRGSRIATCRLAGQNTS